MIIAVIVGGPTTAGRSGSHPAPFKPQPGGRARRPLAGPPEDEVLPRIPRRRPTLQRHARRITSTATADGNATRRMRVEVRGNDPELASYLRLEERELEAGGLD